MSYYANHISYEVSDHQYTRTTQCMNAFRDEAGELLGNNSTIG